MPLNVREQFSNNIRRECASRCRHHTKGAHGFADANVRMALPVHVYYVSDGDGERIFLCALHTISDDTSAFVSSLMGCFCANISLAKRDTKNINRVTAKKKHTPPPLTIS